MKTLITYIIFSLPLLLLSCNQRYAYSSGEKIQEKKALIGVRKLQVDGVFNLILTQSDQESIEVEGPPELIEKLIIDQDGDLLKLETEKMRGFNSNKGDFKIRISLRELEELNYEGVGSIKTNGLFQVGDLKLMGNGVGNLDLELKAKTIDADFDMVGNITLRGQTNRAILKNDGVGNLKASQLIVENMKVTSSGIGNVEIHCEGDLSLVVNGIGKVTYTGSPRIIKKEVNGIGKVKGS